VSRGNGAIDIEMAKNAHDAVSFAVEDAPFEIVTDCVGIVSLVGEDGFGLAFGRVGAASGIVNSKYKSRRRALRRPA
jgi:hypothetical protein